MNIWRNIFYGSTKGGKFLKSIEDIEKEIYRCINSEFFDDSESELYGKSYLTVTIQEINNIKKVCIFNYLNEKNKINTMKHTSKVYKWSILFDRLELFKKIKGHDYFKEWENQISI
jgi:hypothetical protein